MEFDLVTLSRMQFALTALYHFLFVPLTLGLAFILAIMESVYVMTGREIWRDMTRFWGKLFAINFAMGVATGITMEFQFGTNWAYYSHYVGDIFGVPLAIEGMMAFFLESTFVGLFLFGWNKLSKTGHLATTWLMALGANLSALWILIANGWMQNPVGAEFNPDTMRMELVSLWDVFFNPVAQAKFVHTVSAGYVTGAMFVLSISSWYLLRGRHVRFAWRSLAVAASFGLASALSVVVLGDESGYTAGQSQKMKLAAIEAMWETEPAPAGFTVVGLPDQQKMETEYQVKVPWALGLIATRSLTGQVQGIKPLIAENTARIHAGQMAYSALKQLQKNPQNKAARQQLDRYKDDLGYGLLLLRFTDNPVTADAATIKKAALATVPNVPVLFWTFRLMVALGFYFIALFAAAFYFCARRRFNLRWFQRVCLWSMPLPWLAAELGWIVAEYGRQPWAIDGVLPTAMGTSSLGVGSVWLSLGGFVLFYTTLAVVDVKLMLKYIKLGPVKALGLPEGASRTEIEACE